MADFIIGKQSFDGALFKLAKADFDVAKESARNNDRYEVFMTDGQDYFVASTPVGKWPGNFRAKRGAQGTLDGKSVVVTHIDVDPGIYPRGSAEKVGDEAFHKAFKISMAVTAVAAGLTAGASVAGGVAVGCIGGAVSIVAAFVAGGLAARAHRRRQASDPDAGRDLQFEAYRARFEARP